MSASRVRRSIRPGVLSGLQRVQPAFRPEIRLFGNHSHPNTVCTGIRFSRSRPATLNKQATSNKHSHLQRDSLQSKP